MKLKTSKFALSLGLALSISFLFCNLIFYIGGKDFSLGVMNTLFHNLDFKPLLIDNGFTFIKLLCGMIVLFLEGLLLGYLIAFFYNVFTKNTNS